jgi:hypothetical protein
MDRDALEQARNRVARARRGEVEAAEVEAALERARAALEELTEKTAGLEAGLPERLGAALEEALRSEALPVARHIAEVRGLSGQTIRRLERLQGDLDAERKARVEDLALLVELVTASWRGLERRLDRLERILDRLERSLEERPAAPLYRIEEHRAGA